MLYNFSMIPKIVPATDPRLRQKSKEVKKIDKKIRQIIQGLKDTLIVQKDPPGVGLAAPQIGKNLQIFAMKPKEKIRIVINPQIISISKNPENKKGDKKLMEGCLSLPHYYSPLSRRLKIKIRYTTEDGLGKTEKFKNLSARIVQHEIDHLNGVLFTDHLLEQKTRLFEFTNNEWREVELL